MEKSRLYAFYGIYNCIISYFILETNIDTERYVDLLCDTAPRASAFAQTTVHLHENGHVERGVYSSLYMNVVDRHMDT